MATNKLTTRDLIGTLIDLQIDLDNLDLEMNSVSECTHEQSDAWQAEETRLNTAITEIKASIAKKTSGIDHFIVEMNRNKDLIDAEIQSYMDEVKRLRNRKSAIKRSEDYLNKELLPMIISTAGNEGIFKTDTTKYTMFETWGPLEVTDEEAISDNYKRYKVEIDKKKARQDAIKAAEDGMGISGFKIEKAKRIRRS